MMPVRRLSLTDFKTSITRGAREKTLKKALDVDKIMTKWAETAWAKKLKAKDVRKNMTDFERFKLMIAKKKRSIAVKGVLRPAKKETGKKGKK